MPKKIAYQGIEGSFSYLTTQRLPDFSPMVYFNFKAVYESVEAGKADLGLLPIENTLAASSMKCSIF